MKAGLEIRTASGRCDWPTIFSYMIIRPVSSPAELQQIHELNQQNLKTKLSFREQQEQGFVSWPYSVELLQQMHALAPSVIALDQGKVVAYALTAVKECRYFHPDLNTFFSHIEGLTFQGRLLDEYQYYCMGQICVGRQYRGRGIVQLLYAEHKRLFGPTYDFVLTEIATNNARSMRAHEKIGFVSVNTYTSETGEWNVVIWPWRSVV